MFRDGMGDLRLTLWPRVLILLAMGDASFTVTEVETIATSSRPRPAARCAVCDDSGWVLDLDETSGAEADVDCPACGGACLDEIAEVL